MRKIIIILQLSCHLFKVILININSDPRDPGVAASYKLQLEIDKQENNWKSAK